ncbi:MAG: DsrE/DsrF/DrsH-like family protein [Firmicutes bacterium]|jgi:peroxiredoxin family protein|nr:DsrE/DsrF/DrsH-like family protein [Bacillota bacterium]
MGTDKKTLIVFSGDLDRAIAAFVIANGAAAMGDEVTMFFTFWGLSILRKPRRGKVRHPGQSRLQAMFGRLMPSGPDKLRLSQLNFAGMGAPMLRTVMRQKNVASLQSLMATAKEQGIKLLACTMSMDVMGFGPEDLIDGVEFVGVASYLGEADEANVNLFI